jgi:hypothetical protein
MAQSDHLTTIQVDSEISIDRVINWLSMGGMQVFRSFDLQIARKAHSKCPCPYHGTEKCSCQVVILLVYDQGEEPFTLVAHGRDGKTSFSLAKQISYSKNDRLAEEILELFSVDPLP